MPVTLPNRQLAHDAALLLIPLPELKGCSAAFQTKRSGRFGGA
jgi:hypothetical protein